MPLMKNFKAVIVNPDRTSTVKIINKKKRLGSNAFYLGKNKSQIEEVYIINPNHTIITTTKRLGIPFNYQTCYYKKNVPVATPIDSMDGGQAVEELHLLKNDKGRIIGKEIMVSHPISMPQFDNLEKWDGISAEELAQLFNPQFYKMIARANVDKKSDQMWMMQIATLGGVGFILYYMIQNLPKAIVTALGKYLGGG